MSKSQMLQPLAPGAKPTPGPLLIVKRALEEMSDIDFGTPEYTEAAQAVFDLAQAQRGRVVHGSRESLILARVILGLARFLTVDWTQPGIEVSEDGERVLLAAAYGFNPAQARAPRGTSIGGQWIDTPSGLLKVLNTLRRTPVMDLTDEDREAIPQVASEVARSIKNYYYYGTNDAREAFSNPDGVYMERSYGVDGFTVDVDIVSRGSTVAIDGRVVDQWGNDAGYFQRTIFRDNNTGEMVVNHEHLELYEKYRHRGFGTDFSRQSEEMYADLGITRINVTAGLADGGLAWARAGYQISPDNTYIDFDHQELDKFQDTIDRYAGTDDEAAKDFLTGLDMARVPTNYSAHAGLVDLDPTGYTIDDILAFKDSQGIALGEGLLRGSMWNGFKDITPSDYSKSEPMPEVAMAASGQPSTWAQSKERADMLWEFCFSTGAEYTDDDWTTEQANAWRALDADGRARWNSGLTASGFNPNQIRAPRGTQIGGQWIDTPTGLLTRVVDDRPKTPDLYAAFDGYLKDNLVGEYADGQFEVQDIVTSTDYSGYTIKGNVYDKTAGKNVGGFIRKFKPITKPPYHEEVTGVLVEHVSLLMDRSARGRGFGTDFSQRSEALYRDMGIDHIELLAVMDGGYAWARAGYDWMPDSSGNYNIRLREDHIGEMMAQAQREGRNGDAQRLLDLATNVAEQNMAAVPSPSELAAWVDSTGAPIGEAILRGSQWVGIKRLREAQSEEEIIDPLGLGLVASGARNGWMFSEERMTLLADFCRAHQVDMMESWDPSTELAWIALSEEREQAGGLMASGAYAYNPNQARAPRGTPRGGQWIETPTGLLRLVQKLGPTGAGRSESGTDVPGISLDRRAPLEEKFAEAWDDLNDDERAELAMNTKNYLQAAAEEPVKVQMWDNAIEGLANEGRMHTMRERIAVDDYYNGMGYVGAREAYESDIAGVPDDLADDHRPIYGWAQQTDTLWGEGVANYGQNTVTLRPEVKARTTLTIGDSLNYQSRPLWIDEINSEATSVDEFLAASHWAIERNYTADAEIKSINPILWDGGWEVNGDSYIEAQVYGGITLRDIESITIQSRFDFDEGTMQVFEDAGIEIITGDGS